MPNKLLYTLATKSVAGKLGELYALTARLYISSYKNNQPLKWILQAELDGISLQRAYWNFTTADSPPTSSIQRTLAERIAAQIGCKTYEVSFDHLTWSGV